MNLLGLTFSDADLQQALNDFDVALAVLPLEKQNCWGYACLFRDAGQGAEDAGNIGLTIANDVFNALSFGATGEGAQQPLSSVVETIRANLDAGKEPFEGLVPADGSAPSKWVEPVARLQTPHYDALQRVFPSIKDPQLRARVADFLWLTRRNHWAANAAVSAYLDASRHLRQQGWAYGIVFLKRALRIEKSLNSKNKIALTEFESELQKHRGDSTYYSRFLLDLMLELKVGQSATCAFLAEEAARVAEAEPDWDRAESYWHLAIEWQQKAKNAAGKAAAQWALAKCYEKHATWILAQPNRASPYSHATHWIEQSIGILRETGGSIASNEAERLHLLLVNYQHRSLSEMQLIQHAVDLSAEFQFARQQVAGLPLEEALARFAGLRQPPRLTRLCRDSLAIARQTVFLSRTAKRQISTTGGTAAREKRLADKRADKRERRRVRMIQHARLNQELCSMGVLTAGLQVLISEHHLREKDFLPLLEPCIFVPPGHERLVARGLAEGWRGEWMASAHLLVPQLEIGFRSLLIDFGALPPPEVQRGEREWGMQEFLYDMGCLNVLSQIFGEKLLYDARVLLCEKFGANLRSQIEHGLLPDGAFGSQFTNFLFYLWWLSLCLVFAALHFQLSSCSPAESTPDAS